MIDEINRTRSDHILTIEDPIEFVHRHKRCIVNQREIGVDATSFGEALRGALRQDPDVILVGEMRDLETIGTAHDRRRDRPPRLRHAAHAVGALARSTASSTSSRPSSRSRCAIQLAGTLAGRRHAGAAADRRRLRPRARARDPAPRRRRPQPDPPGQGRADLLGHADRYHEAGCRRWSSRSPT